VTRTLGYGIGLAMGAELSRPDKLCINVWGDAAIGFTGMEFETGVRERIPILSVLFDNFCMAIETPLMGLKIGVFHADLKINVRRLNNKIETAVLRFARLATPCVPALLRCA
jgi:thiamine pyrophosphate-dependent acetolactate synthase large subunit-like protein